MGKKNNQKSGRLIFKVEKISIVTAIHNGLEYNKLFYESLSKYTYYPYELIIIDNDSCDGSAEFFEDNGAIVIRNKENLCYSCSQNIGIKHSSSKIIAFLNNDIYLSKDWDKILISYMEDYNLYAISPCGIETMESQEKTKRFMRKWRLINSIQRLRNAFNLKYSSKDLLLLLKLMYGNWEKFTEKRKKDFNHFLYPGISGNAVLVKKEIFDKIGMWNIFVTGPDWEFQQRLVKAQCETNKLMQCMIAQDVFVHHFIRATARTYKNSYSCTHKRINVIEYIKKEDRNYLSRPIISLIIAVYNKPDFLEMVFTSLLNQTIDDFEVIVSDDGSGPQIKQLIEKWQGKFKYPIIHVYQEHEGFRKTKIANASVIIARSDYLCFIDGDSILHHKFLQSHLKYRKVKTVLSGRRVMLSENFTKKLTLTDIKSKRIEKFLFIKNGSSGNTIKYCFWVPFMPVLENILKKQYWILGSNFSCYKGDYYSINGYDESITGRGLEDNNLCARFKKKGLKIKNITREAIQYHLFHNSDPIPHDKETIKKYGHPDYFWAKYGIIKA